MNNNEQQQTPLPPAFIEAAKEAGERLEGWLGYSRNVIAFHVRDAVVTVETTLSGDDGMIFFSDRDDFLENPRCRTKFVNLGSDTLGWESSAPSSGGEGG